MNLTMYSGFSKAAFENGWEYAADMAVSYGCSSIETIDFMNMPSLKPLDSLEDALSARKTLENRGLNVACCSAFTNLYKSPEAVIFLKRRAEIAAALGSPFLHHTVLNWFDLSAELPDFDEAMECAIDAAVEVAKHAETLGITCIYEDQGFFANGIDNYRIFINEMKRRCNNVGVCGDMGNCLFADVTGEDFFKAFASDIKHVHVKDYFLKKSAESPDKGWYKTIGGNWLKDAPLGEGVVDIASCLKTLKEVGYSGAVAIETNEIENAVKYLKSLTI